jgi:glycerol-3-phosphate acyltransferase PlsY
VIDLIVKALLSYMLGGLLGGLIIGKLKGGVDIRKQGSGNAGGTNALRTQGWWFALWVMIIDIGKGWIAVRVIAQLSLPVLGDATSPLSMQWSGVVCAMAVVVGHVYPCWFGFRGGKGAATLVGVVWGLAPAALPWVLGLWLLSLMISGFVGLSTMLATFGFNFWVWLQQPQVPLLVFSISMTVFVIYTHRANIKRMRAGQENRAKSLWLFRPRATTNK